MYDRFYELLVNSGYYALKIDQSVFFDKHELPVPDKDTSKKYGKCVDIKFSKPELIFVAGECGTNTNMSNDKLSNGNKRAHKKKCNVTIP